MLTIKIIAIAVFLLQVLSFNISIVAIVSISAGLTALINSSSIALFRLAKSNLMILSFSLFFAAFGIISGLIANELNIKIIIEIIIKIFFTFNCIYLGLLWIGRKGLMQILNIIPSKRLYLFILLFYNTTEYLMRTHNRILYQLKVRINFAFFNKLLIARYYVKNLIYKEAYAFQHHQASYYTRINTLPRLYIKYERPGLPDIIALSVIIAGAFARFIL